MAKPQAEKIVIREAVVIVKGSLRLHVMRDKTYRDRASSGTWLDWTGPEAVQATSALRAAGMLFGGKKFAIPAHAVLGADKITRIQIDWGAKFRQRAKLLVSWVMEE